jgi:hypothetical protein
MTFTGHFFAVFLLLLSASAHASESDHKVLEQI